LLVGGERPEDALEPWTLALSARAAQLTTRKLERVYQQMASLPALMNDFFSHYDVILSPVVSAPAPLLGRYGPSVAADVLMQTMFDWVSYTPLHNMAGIPAISLPLFASSDGLPIGSMFSANRHQEDTLLGLAYELESAAPWRDRWPPLSVMNSA
jgi:amidase